MDIQINAAQGRGKSTLARAIANTQGGIVYEYICERTGHINIDAVARKIVEARADVVIFDEADDWMVRPYKDAVQKARQTLRRHIFGIYCTLDGNVAPDVSSQAFIPFGFVNAADAFARMDDRPRNTFKVDPEQLRAADFDAAKFEAGITEQAVGDMATKSYTADELLAMARLIHDHGNQTAIDELRGVYQHFGVEGVAVLPPLFHATAHALILPIWQAVVAGLRNKCRDIVKSHISGAAVPQSLRTLVQKYGINVADVDAKHLPELYEKLQQYGK